MYTDDGMPRRWAICDECCGEGKSSAHLGCFSMEDLQEDPDFCSDYFSGRYDRACQACHGTGKVKEIAYDHCTPEQMEALRIEADANAELAAERRMRAMGYQF